MCEIKNQKEWHWPQNIYTYRQLPVQSHPKYSFQLLSAVTHTHTHKRIPHYSIYGVVITRATSALFLEGVGTMQISEVEEKPFTSSSNNCPEAFCRKGWGGRSNFSQKDDVTVILLLGVSFMV
jgi:hypothetical protein